MLQRARLIAGLALGWGLVHGLHAGALLLMPALLPRCGGSGAAAWWLEALTPWVGTLGTLASFSTQAAALLVGPVVLAAGRRWSGRRPSARESVADGSVKPILERYALPTQEIHAVCPSPKLVPGKVSAFIEFLREAMGARGGSGPCGRVSAVSMHRTLPVRRGPRAWGDHLPTSWDGPSLRSLLRPPIDDPIADRMY